MKKHVLKANIIAGLISFALPALVFAQAQGLIPCNGPDCTFDSFVGLINNIIRYFIDIAASVAAITFAYAGARILLHPGNPSERENAKKMFEKTVIGMAIVLLSWLVIYTVIKTFVPAQFNALRFLGK